MVSDTDAEVQRITLIDSLDGEWLKLPFAIMRDSGPAVQTMAGLLKITDKETFHGVKEMARCARLPVPTVRKHLVTLDANGWIHNAGRQRTKRSNVLRRTATIKVTKDTRDRIEPYGLLPWWACCHIRNLHGKRGRERLPWSTKAVLSVVMARLCSLKKGVEDQDGHGADADEIAGSIENFGAEDRFQFSLKRLAADTGLDHKSITAAKQLLHRVGIVCWYGERNGMTTDSLYPNWDFAVIETPAGPGRVYLDFDKGSDCG